MEEHITENQIIHSNFFTNRNGNTLMKEFEGVLQHNNHIKNLDAVVGFLRASGYFSLRPFLDSINKVRVLSRYRCRQIYSQSGKSRKNILWGGRRSERRLLAQYPQGYRAFQLYKRSGEWYAPDGSRPCRW